MREDEQVKIAVLDDNLPIGEMLRQGLGLAGHTVFVYSCPSQFFSAFYVERAKNASAPFEAMLVDLHLGEGISGVEVIRQVRKIIPGLPLILISAGASWEIEAARKALPTVKVLQKPFKIATLLAMIQELLKCIPM